MTLSTTAPVQSPLNQPGQSLPPPPLPVPTLQGDRGDVDPVLPSCGMLARRDSHRSSTASTPVMSPASETGLPARPPSYVALPTRRKAAQDLRLSYFGEVGLESPFTHPAALLTPPEDVVLGGLAHPEVIGAGSGADPQQRPMSNLPDTPSGMEGVIPSMDGTANAPPVPTFGNVVTITTPHGHVSELRAGGTPTPEACDVPKSPKSGFNDCVDFVASTAVENQSSAVLNVLCHTQPSPLPSDGNPTTVFTALIPGLQQKIDVGSYIEITHAIPVGYNMSQVPQSPIATPNVLQQQEPNDYFSVQNTFSKAVVATSFSGDNAAQRMPSPLPIVAPASVHISLLERYIPPAYSEEATSLFSPKGSSALLNRLSELSPNSGTLIFIYPTKRGGQTFNANYLGPILHPLLRRMAGINGLSSDLGSRVAHLGSIDHLLNFPEMQHQLSALLSALSRPRSSSSTSPSGPINPASTPTRRSSTSSSKYRPPIPPSTFQLTHSAPRTIQLDRQSWQAWFLHQEKQRIKQLVSDYFKRGVRLPSQMGVTAGTICREILEGLEMQEYAADCPPREGVEVGVFVVRRTA